MSKCCAHLSSLVLGAALGYTLLGTSPQESLQPTQQSLSQRRAAQASGFRRIAHSDPDGTGAESAAGPDKLQHSERFDKWQAANALRSERTVTRGLARWTTNALYREDPALVEAIPKALLHDKANNIESIDAIFRSRQAARLLQ